MPLEELRILEDQTQPGFQVWPAIEDYLHGRIEFNPQGLARLAAAVVAKAAVDASTDPDPEVRAEALDWLMDPETGGLFLELINMDTKCIEQWARAGCLWAEPRKPRQALKPRKEKQTA